MHSYLLQKPCSTGQNKESTNENKLLFNRKHFLTLKVSNLHKPVFIFTNLLPFD